MKKNFECKNCGNRVSYKAWGTKNRNHCPYCLFSLHVDKEIGDRKSKCCGLMKPIGRFCKPDGEEMLIHECNVCGLIRKNRVAGDDNFDEVEKLAVLESL